MSEYGGTYGAGARRLRFMSEVSHTVNEQLPEHRVGEVPGIRFNSRGEMVLFCRSGDGPLVLRFGDDWQINCSWHLPTKGLAHGLEIDSKDDLLLTVWTDSYVGKHDPDTGKQLMTVGDGAIGKTGASVEGDFRSIKQADHDRLNGTCGVAIDGEGYLVLADGYLNTSIKCADPNEGTILSGFGEHGDAPHQLGMAHHVAVAPDETIWVCDRENNLVKVFQRDGTLVESIEACRPNAVYFDPEGYVWIIEQGNQNGMYPGVNPVGPPQWSRIRIFDPGMKEIAQLGGHGRLKDEDGLFVGHEMHGRFVRRQQPVFATAGVRPPKVSKQTPGAEQMVKLWQLAA